MRGDDKDGGDDGVVGCDTGEVGGCLGGNGSWAGVGDLGLGLYGCILGHVVGRFLCHFRGGAETGTGLGDLHLHLHRGVFAGGSVFSDGQVLGGFLFDGTGRWHSLTRGLGLLRLLLGGDVLGWW